MTLGIFDVIAIIIVLLSALMAFARGFIREVLSIVAFVGGALAALYGGYQMLGQFFRSFVDNGFFADLLGGVVAFVIVFILITIATWFIMRAFNKVAEIGWIDRIAGLAFGIARGLLVIGFLVLLMHIFSRGTDGEGGKFFAFANRSSLCPVYERAGDAVDNLASLFQGGRSYLKPGEFCITADEALALEKAPAEEPSPKSDELEKSATP